MSNSAVARLAPSRPTSPETWTTVGGAAIRPVRSGARMPIEPAPIGAPAYSENLPRKAQSAQPARALVTSALRVWDLEDYADSACLIVTELVANAAQHAAQKLVRVTVTRTAPRRVRIGVVDRSGVMPQLHKASCDDEDGRGLAIIDSLTDGRWDVDRLSWGKRVWAELGEDGGEA